MASNLGVFGLDLIFLLAVPAPYVSFLRIIHYPHMATNAASRVSRPYLQRPTPPSSLVYSVFPAPIHFLLLRIFKKV